MLPSLLINQFASLDDALETLAPGSGRPYGAVDSLSPLKQGRSWVIGPPREGWVFRKSFPTKWKAQLALETWRRGGRVSDYWTAAREAVRQREANARAARRGTASAKPYVEVGTPESRRPAREQSKNESPFAAISGFVVAMLGMALFSFAIFAVPLVGVGLVVLLAVRVPPVGAALVALVGGIFALGLAGAGRQGWRTSHRGGWYYNYWGSPPLSAFKALLVFLLGAALALRAVLGD